MKVKMENNQKEIIKRFDKVKIEIDQSIKNFEIKIAEIIADKKFNGELKHDIKKLEVIISEVDNNLIEIKDMLK